MITPEVPQGFGFRQALRRFLARPLGVLAVVTSLSGLVWMWVDGHGIEVLLAVLAAVPIAVLDATYEDIKAAIRKQRGRKSHGVWGERAWR